MIRHNGHTRNGHAKNGHAAPEARPSDYMPVLATYEDERNVLGPALYAPEADAQALTAGLTAEWFVSPAARAVYAAHRRLAAQGIRADAGALAADLEERGTLPAVAGSRAAGRSAVFGMLAPGMGYERDPEPFARSLARLGQAYRLRAAYDAAADLLTRLSADGLTLEERMDALDEQAQQIARNVAGRAASSGYAADEVRSLGALYDGIKAGTVRLQESTGFPGLDARCGGYPAGRLTLIAARSSHGKTAFSLASASRMLDALDEEGRDEVILFFTPELTRRDFAVRIACLRYGFSAFDFRAGNLTSDQRAALDEADAALGRLIIDDEPMPSVAYVRARVAACPKPVHAVFFDYLEYAHVTEEREKVMRMERALLDLHAMAKTTGRPVVVIHQINREMDRRGGDPQPQLSDMSWTDAAVKLPALILMLMHPHTHYFQTGGRGYGDGRPDPARYVVYVRKNTSGPVGSLELDFDAATGRFKARPLALTISYEPEPAPAREEVPF